MKTKNHCEMHAGEYCAYCVARMSTGIIVTLDLFNFTPILSGMFNIMVALSAENDCVCAGGQ